MKSYEELLNCIGGFGNYQILLWIWVLTAILATCAQMGFMIFGAIVPQITCMHQAYNQSNPNIGSTANNNNHTLNENCTFLNHFYSIAQEWNLIGVRNHLVAFITSMQMVGVFVGPMFLGYIADRYGRKTTFIVSHFLFTIGCLLSIFSVNWQMFATIRFLIGFACGGTITTSFVLYSECVPQKGRLIGHSMVWPICFIYLGVLAKLFPHWKSLSIAITVTCVLAVVTTTFVLESPKWLLELGHKEKAMTILKQIVAINRRFRKPKRNLHHIVAEIESFMTTLDDKSKVRQVYPFWYLCHNRKLALAMIGLLYSFVTAGLSFYVLIFSLGNFAGNPALNTIYVNLVRLLLVGFLPQIVDAKIPKLGRRMIYGFALIIYTIVAVLLSLVFGFSFDLQHPFLPVLLAMIANSCGGLIFTMITVMMIEIGPTELRNTAASLCNSGSRIGSILAPYIALLFGYWKWSPFAVIAVVLVINIVVLLTIITETKGKPLPDLPPRLKRLSQSKS